MKFSRSVEVEDGVERSWMSIEEIFIVEDVVIGAELKNLRMSVGSTESSKARVWNLLKHFPHDFMPLKTQGVEMLNNIIQQFFVSI